jgi:K+-transporting ATPase c subunit
MDEVKSSDAGAVAGESKGARVADGAGAGVPEQRTWTPTSEHDQLTIVHSALLQSHVNALVQSVAQGAPSAVLKVHADAIQTIASTLSTHINEKASSDQIAKVAADKAVAAKVVAAPSGSKLPEIISAVVGTVIAVAIAIALAHVKGWL